MLYKYKVRGFEKYKGLNNKNLKVTVGNKEHTKERKSETWLSIFRYSIFP